MALIRWETAPSAAALPSDFGRLFSTFFETPGNGAGISRFVPAMDLIETEDGFVLRADLPGLTEADVNIEVDDRVLTVSGRREEERDERQTGVYRVERTFGEFTRSLMLPEGVEPESVAASFEHGVLEVRVPKPEQRKPHRISISDKGADKTIEGQATESEPAHA